MAEVGSNESGSHRWPTPKKRKLESAQRKKTVPSRRAQHKKTVASRRGRRRGQQEQPSPWSGSQITNQTLRRFPRLIMSDEGRQYGVTSKKVSQSHSTSAIDSEQLYKEYLHYPQEKGYMDWKKKCCYTLDELFKTKFPLCSKFIENVMENLKEKKNQASAMCHLFLKHCCPDNQKYYTFEKQFSCFQHLPSLGTSTAFITHCYLCISDSDQQDDVKFIPFSSPDPNTSCHVCTGVDTTTGIFQKLKTEGAIPVVLIEVDSGKFWGSLHKCGIAVFENFRLARSLGADVNEWSGFLFPNRFKKEAVTKVTVKTTPSCIEFSIDVEFVKMDDVATAVKSVYDAQAEVLSGKTTNDLDHRYVYKLSPPELESLAVGLQKSLRTAEPLKCHQLGSVTSYLFYCHNQNSSYYIKRLISPFQDRQLHAIEAFFRKHEIQDYPVVLSKETLPFHEVSFYCFDALSEPLSTEEARCCLREFVRLVSESLEYLHQTYGKAHIDVRTDNICFIPIPDEQGKCRAYLLDIDRCCNKDKMMDGKWVKTESALYCSDFTNEQIDWRQLGCSLYWIVKSEVKKKGMPPDIHSLDLRSGDVVMNDLTSECELDDLSASFVFHLIFEGRLEKENIAKVFRNKKYSKSVMDVLQQRTTLR